MKRPIYINYSGLRESKLLDYSTDQDKYINYLEKENKKLTNRTFIPFQKCPKCDGQGIVSKPAYITGDQDEWNSTSISYQCNVCNGEKIIKCLTKNLKL